MLATRATAHASTWNMLASAHTCWTAIQTSWPGERQRVAIARALAAEPSLLVCDEITSSLDVSVQGSIVELLEQLRLQMGLSLLFVTHDLGLTRTIADRVMVMNQGVVMEAGFVDQVFDAPAAAYTRELLHDTPSLERHLAATPSPEDGRGD